jgi:hypothetical protein
MWLTPVKSAPAAEDHEQGSDGSAGPKQKKPADREAYDSLQQVGAAVRRP